jgi:N-glycosylase/DNA lyase
MEYRVVGNEIEIKGVCDFDLTKTFECGQCFRWDADESGVYFGVAFGRATGLRRGGESIYISCSEEDFMNIWRGYFDLDRNYAEIRRHLCVDELMHQATDFGKGIRLLRQEKWEALCSFIISQNNNIPRIKKIIAALCREFGESFDFEGVQYFTFPSAEKLACLSESDFAPLRTGYRAAYIIAAAKAVASRELNLEQLSLCTPKAARIKLKKQHGVGDKVADCVMLFGLHMLDAFPRDVWMNRAVNEFYGQGFNPEIFSPYAGIAQQYIFHYTRNKTLIS